MMETSENNQRMAKCPHFNRCSAPICPLDEFSFQRVYLSNEPKCDMEKPVRFRIGRDMPSLGLLPQELSSTIQSYGDINKAREALLIRFLPSVVKNNSSSVGNHVIVA